MCVLARDYFDDHADKRCQFHTSISADMSQAKMVTKFARSIVNSISSVALYLQALLDSGK